MAINKKLIHFENRENFDARLANNEINDTSIVFIQDTGELWTHGRFFCTTATNLLEAPSLLTLGDTIAVQIGDKTSSYIVPPAALKGRTMYECITNTTDTRGHWTGTVPGVTELYDGLVIHVRFTTSYYGNSEGYNTLNINNLGPKLIWYRYGSILTTHWGSNAELTLTYRTTAGSYKVGNANGELTNGTTYTDGWVADYAYYTDGNYLVGSYYFRSKINANGYIGRYMLFMRCPDGTVTGLTTTNNSTATNKTMYSGPLLLGLVWYYASTSTFAANANFYHDGANIRENYSLVDVRYTFNCGSTLVSYKPFFIVGSIGNDGYFYLDTTQPWSLEYPDNDNGKIYILLGYAYDTYRINFEVHKPMYIYKNGGIQLYSQYASETEWANITGKPSTFTPSTHTHPYTDLTGSTTTANLAIVSNGTANGWTLKTLGSRAFDSTEYVTLATNQTISGLKTFSNGFLLNTTTAWDNVDRSIPFTTSTNDLRVQYVYNNANKGLTFNPSTGALKAGSFIKRGGTSSQFLKADGSVDSNRYIPYGASLLTTNVFAPDNDLYITKIDNCLYAADDRFVVTHKYYDSNDNLLGNISTNLFDGNYEQHGSWVTDGRYAEVYIGKVPEADLDSASTYLWTYGEGTMYLCFYSSLVPTSVEVQVYCLAHSGIGVTRGWKTKTATQLSTSIWSVKISGAGSVYTVAYKIKYTGKTTDSFGASLSEIELRRDRTSISETPAVTKYAIAQTIEGNLTAKKLAIKGGTSSLFLKADGSVDSNTYSTTSHTHAWDSLTRSSTTANQVIVSTSTANGWELKTLGSNAFNSTGYLPLTGGTLSGNLAFSHGNSSTDQFITWASGTHYQRLKVRDGLTDVFVFLYSTDSGSTWLDYFTIRNGSALIGTNTVLNSSNYTTYTVKKDGTGATGTWGIGITGNAGTATEFASALSITLTGDTTGTASSKAGWSIATTTKYLTGTPSGNYDLATTAMTTAMGNGKVTYYYKLTNNTTGLFAATNNANSMFTFNKHDGSYDSQLGFSSNGNIYYRSFANVAPNTTQTWKQIAFTDSNITGQASYSANVGSAGTLGTNYVAASKVIAACNWYDTVTGSDTDSVINRWDEIVNFVAGFEETPDLATYLANNYLAKTGNSTSSPMTGTIYFKDVNPLILLSTNQDLDIWRVTGNTTGSLWDNTFGFYLRYNGTGLGNDNSLSLWANNQLSNDVEVYRIKLNGILNFLKTPTINGTAISLSGHTHDERYVKLSATEQTIESTISGYAKGIVEFYRSSGDHIAFIQFANKVNNTKRVLGSIGFYSGGIGKLLYRSPSAEFYDILHGGNVSTYVQGSTITLSTTAQTFLTVKTGLSGSLSSTTTTIKLPETDPYTSARTPTSHNHYATRFNDSRNDAMTPEVAAAVNGVAIDFKTNANGVSAGTGSYCGLVTFDPYSDVTGGYPLQMGFNSGLDANNTNLLYIRTVKDANTWNSWRTVITSANIGNYASSTSHDHDSTYLKLSGGTMTGAIKYGIASGANDTTLGINFGTAAHIGASTSLGMYTTGSIFLRPNLESLTNINSNGVVITSTAFTYNETNVSLEGHTHADYVTSVGVTDDATNHANLLRYVKDGISTYFTVPFATNADTVDGYHETSFLRARGLIATSYVDLTTYTANAEGYINPQNGMWSVQRGGYSEGLITFTGSGSTSGLDLWFHYAKGNFFKFRRRIDSNRVSGAWETFITDLNYTSYTVKKDGTGASGTWGISISGTATTANNLNKATLGYLYQSATTTTDSTGTVTATSGKIGVPIQFYGSQVNYALANDLFYATVANNAITADTVYLGDAIKSKTFVKTSTHIPTGASSGSSSSSGTPGEAITYTAGNGIKITGTLISTNTWTGTESQFAELSNPGSYDLIYIIED